MYSFMPHGSLVHFERRFLSKALSLEALGAQDPLDALDGLGALGALEIAKTQACSAEDITQNQHRD